MTAVQSTTLSIFPYVAGDSTFQLLDSCYGQRGETLKIVLTGEELSVFDRRPGALPLPISIDRDGTRSILLERVGRATDERFEQGRQNSETILS